MRASVIPSGCRPTLAAAAGLAWLMLWPAPALAQRPSSLRVIVQDETASVLVHAVVTLIDQHGVERSVLVDERGEALFTGLPPGPYRIRVEAEGFQSYTGRFTVRPGANTAVATLTVAVREEVEVREADPAARRDHGFTTTLREEDLAGLSDDPEEMEEQLRQMAGPGAEIFVDGFRGGRLPPKDQILQVRLSTNSYAAEYHDAGMVRVEIVTKPGMGNWRGQVNFGFRDETLNARNAFAPTRGPEQQKRLMTNLQGPLARGKTTLAFAFEGNLSYDSRTIHAWTPAGIVRDQVRRPVEGMHATVRVEQLLGPGHSLRIEYGRSRDVRRNLGVGDFDLPERAFDTAVITDTLRVHHNRALGRRLSSDLRAELSRSRSSQHARSERPTVRVLDAFTAGGAGQAGWRDAWTFVLAPNVDFALGRRHSGRFGALVEAGWWDSALQTHANGTFIFSSLDEFLAGRPRTYSRRVGDPQVQYSGLQAGWYIQDDIRLRRTLSVSLGLRQELQTHVGDWWNLAPRAAFTWDVGRGSVRGGWGVFYEWLDADVYEQTLRVDGTRQVEEIIVDPSFPDPNLSGGVRLPPSRIQLAPTLTQPLVRQMSVGYERPLATRLQVRADYMRMRGTHAFRSINVNAPLDGVRPDPRFGNVVEVSSTGRRATDRVSVALMLRAPERRVMGHVSYQWARTRNHADSPLSLPADSTNPDADWGPAGSDVRHRVFALLNAPLPFGLRIALQAQYASPQPYTITTGTDDNGDTVFTDRPPGVGRNTARGDTFSTVNVRLSRPFAFGRLLGPGEGPVAVGGPPSGPAPRGEGGGPQIVTIEASNRRYRLDLYVQVFNLFNATNLGPYVGNLRSPSFGRAVSAAPPRRVELGVAIGF